MVSAASRSAAPITLAQLISVAPRFGRSVHLEHDAAASSAARGAFYLTPSAREALESLSRGLDVPAERATILIGSYGAGKSALCVFLTQLLNGAAQARETLRAADPTVCESWTRASHKLLPVTLVGAREPLAPALVRALRTALTERAPQVWQALQNRAAAKTETPAPREVADFFQDAARLLQKGSEYTGLLLLADEMGKFLEYAALHPEEGDVFTLQELAEAAARSGETPLLVVGVLHQDASAYAGRLSRAQQAEWAKIAERFRQVPLFPSDTERMDLIGRALSHDGALEVALGNRPKKLAQRCAEFVGTGQSARFTAMARAAYPLHPVALLALPRLFRRSGQSHRTLFNFLSGEEPGALGRFLRETTFDTKQPPFYRLDAAFPYVRDVLLAGGSGAESRVWAEAVEAVERATNSPQEITPLALRVLQTIALLNWLRDPSLAPSEALLAAAFDNENWRAALDELERRRLIAWSRARDAYRLWEGGDLDIEAEIARAQRELEGDVVLLAAANAELPQRLIARRHSFQSGTLRSARVLATRPALLAAQLKEAQRDDDSLLVVLCLTTTPEESANALQTAHEFSDPQFLFGVTAQSEMLVEVAREVAATAHLSQTLAFQESDRASRRELEMRREDAETLFQREWKRAFGVVLSADDFSSGNATTWIYRGAETAFEAPEDFPRLLSAMADATFPARPILQNELLNRRRLSSAGAAARRNLIAAMIEHGAHERLGLTGFPPEAAIYESVLRATGLHRENESGAWHWGAPRDGVNGANLLPSWRALEAMIFAPTPREVPLGELFTKLRRPPFGLTDGVLPVLLCAFLQAHDGETSLYKDGAFLPEARAADWEVLLRRADLFAVAGCRVSGTRAQIVARLASSLNEEAAVAPLVRRLFKMARALPEHAWKTRRLPPRVLALRESIERARSPERWLFQDLPLALDQRVFDDDTDDAQVADFFAALNAALSQWSAALPNAMQTARDELLCACGLTPSENGWNALRAGLQNPQAILHPLLATLAQRLTGHDAPDAALDSVLSLIAQRPPRSWGDAEIESFAARAAPYGAAFRELNHNAPATAAASTRALSEAEEKAAVALSKRLQKSFLDKDGIAVSPQVCRVALERLLASLPAPDA